MKNVGVDGAPAARARSRSDWMSATIECLSMQSRHAGTATPTFAASESNTGRAAANSSHFGWLANNASPISQNLLCTEAHMAASAAGIGTVHHLSGELFNALAGTDIQHIPYRGGNAPLWALKTVAIFPLPQSSEHGRLLDLHQAGGRVLHFLQGRAREAAHF